MEMTIEQYRLLDQDKISGKKRANHWRGKAAQQYGKLAEKAVDQSLDNYAFQKLLVWKATGSKTQTYIDQQGRRRVRHVEHGPPDRSITLTPNGQSLYLEIKHLKNSVTTALIARAFQYDDLLSNVEMGGLGGYLIWWTRHNQWRYHPASTCAAQGFGENRKVRVNYEGSLAVPSYGWQQNMLLDGAGSPAMPLPEPDWLEVVTDYRRG